MDKIDFQREFEKIARKQGMGEAISAAAVCHKAREVLNEVFPEGEGEVVSFKNGLLTVKFKSSAAIAAFHLKNNQFLKQLNAASSRIHITELKVVLC